MKYIINIDQMNNQNFNSLLDLIVDESKISYDSGQFSTPEIEPDYFYGFALDVTEEEMLILKLQVSFTTFDYTNNELRFYPNITPLNRYVSGYSYDIFEDYVILNHEILNQSK